MSYRTHNLPNYGEVKVYWLGSIGQMFAIAMTFWGRIRCSQMVLSDKLVRHEVIHLKQGKEVTFFLLKYFWLWIACGFSYNNHPMEKDANEFENDINFKVNRPENNWRKYK